MSELLQLIHGGIVANQGNSLGLSPFLQGKLIERLKVEEAKERSG